MYAQKNEPGVHEAIEVAKTFERRRCGHHPDEYPEPLSTQECTQSVIDPKETGQNKHRYVVASQDVEVRRMLRSVRGVPLIYIKRSVMILEPMADESAQQRAREERIKFRAEIKNALGKRKRDADQDEDSGDDNDKRDLGEGQSAEDKKSKKKGKGPKGPNPLSVKKSKKKDDTAPKSTATKTSDGEKQTTENSETTGPAKRKRRRKNKSKAEGGEKSEGAGEAETARAIVAEDA